MTQQEFFDWAKTQDAPCEFDGFQPVAMTGGTLGHSSVIRNINVQFTSRLRGKPCEPLGPDAGVATVGDTVRYPDAVVTCTEFDARDRLVPSPVTVLSRDRAGEAFRAAGLTEDDTLHLPEVGIEIPVAAIYEGIALNGKRAPDA